MYRINMKEVRQLDTMHKDTNNPAKINNMRHKHERDTGVCGSPQTQGYVHQTIASCDIYFIKELRNTSVSIHFSVIFMVSSLESLSELFPHYRHKYGILHNSKQGIASILKFANLTTTCIYQPKQVWQTHGKILNKINIFKV